MCKIESSTFTTRSIQTNKQTEEHDPQFEPVVKLTEQVEAKTHEEDEEVLFKMSVLPSCSEPLLHWKIEGGIRTKLIY